MVDRAVGWTLETLHEHLLTRIIEGEKRQEQRSDANEKSVHAALMAAKEAVTKAEASSEKRFEGVNEFRAALSDQQNTFIPRSEVHALIAARDAKLDTLEKQLDRMVAEKRGFNAGYGYVVGAVGLLLALVSVILRLRGQ